MLSRLLTAGVVTGLGLLAGCTAASPPPTAATTANTRQIAATTPGTGKGHWVDEPTTQTGTFVRRRIWIPDDGSGPVVAPAGNVQTFGAPRASTGLSQPNGRGFGGG